MRVVEVSVSVLLSQFVTSEIRDSGLDCFDDCFDVWSNSSIAYHIVAPSIKATEQASG